jgi:hypothetical protein
MPPGTISTQAIIWILIVPPSCSDVKGKAYIVESKMHTNQQVVKIVFYDIQTVMEQFVLGHANIF